MWRGLEEAGLDWYGQVGWDEVSVAGGNELTPHLYASALLPDCAL